MDLKTDYLEERYPEAPELPIEEKVYYDETGRKVAATTTVNIEARHWQVDVDPRIEIIRAMLDFIELLGADDALSLGQRLLVILFKCGRSPHKTQRELADAMRISESRLSHIMAEMPGELDSLMKLNRRQSNPRKVAV